MKKRCKTKSYNTGGAIVNMLPQVVGAVNPVAGAVVGLGMNIIKNQLNPMPIQVSDYQTSYRGFNMGGSIDNKINPGAIEVQGNPGIDTNPRNINGAPVKLTEGEVVTNNHNNDGSLVFSDDSSMIDPMTGKTFAELSRKIEMSNKKAHKTLDKYPKDLEAKNTLEMNKLATDKLFKRQESLKNPQDELPQQEMKKGGKINYATGGNIPGTSYSFINYLNSLNNPNLGPQVPTNVTPTNVAVAPMDATTDTQTYLQLGDYNRGKGTTPRYYVAPMDPQAATNIRTQPTATQTPSSQNPSFSTFGDYAYVAAKGVELLGKNAIANQKVDTYNASDYTVSKPVFNPNQQFQKGNQSFRAATYNVNTGNANLDRALMSTLYTSNLNMNSDVATQYQQMQNQSDLAVDQFNSQMKLNVNNINDQNYAAKQKAQDAVLTSVGNFGQVIQDMSNTRATNRIAFATLQGMSQKYKINVEQLTKIMQNDPAQFNSLLIQYQGS